MRCEQAYTAYGLLAESNVPWHVCMGAEGPRHYVDRVCHVPANLHQIIPSSGTALLCACMQYCTYCAVQCTPVHCRATHIFVRCGWHIIWYPILSFKLTNNLLHCAACCDSGRLCEHAGNLWCHGQDRENRFHIGASPALSGSQRLCPVSTAEPTGHPEVANMLLCHQRHTSTAGCGFMDQHTAQACFVAVAACWCTLIQCACGCRAQILAKKVSARAFKVVPGKQGETAGDIGIEGTAIEAPTEASLLALLLYTRCCCTNPLHVSGH